LRWVTGAVTVLVSHRFSTVRLADLIVVLDRGVLDRGQNAPSLSSAEKIAFLDTLAAQAVPEWQAALDRAFAKSAAVGNHLHDKPAWRLLVGHLPYV
jgi:hypothetical protein